MFKMETKTQNLVRRRWGERSVSSLGLGFVKMFLLLKKKSEPFECIYFIETVNFGQFFVYFERETECQSRQVASNRFSSSYITSIIGNYHLAKLFGSGSDSVITPMHA